MSQWNTHSSWKVCWSRLFISLPDRPRRIWTGNMLTSPKPGRDACDDAPTCPRAGPQDWATPSLVLTIKIGFDVELRPSFESSVDNASSHMRERIEFAFSEMCAQGGDA